MHVTLKDQILIILQFLSFLICDTLSRTQLTFLLRMLFWMRISIGEGGKISNE